MKNVTRRGFLADVGKGMVAAGLGFGAARELGLAPAFAEEGPESLRFGPLEPLVALLQETPAEKLLPLLVEKLRGGTSLRDLLAAGALANARSFGGEDYIGFHTLMALSPAYHMSGEMPEERRALPVLKVLYRNTHRIQEAGGARAEVLRPVRPAPIPEGKKGGEALREAVRGKDLERAEGIFASIAGGKAEDAFDHLLTVVEDATEVHRVVLPYRAWDLLELIGKENAHTLLRQSVRYCIRHEKTKRNDRYEQGRVALARLLEAHGLPGKATGSRKAEDAWVDELSRTIFGSTPEAAAEAAAKALAEGFEPQAVGEAVALAANALLLRDAGRPESQSQPGKPAGSVHGDSIGVHACDSANAWRNMSRVAALAGEGQRNAAACLILGAYQVAFDRGDRGGDFLSWRPHPLPDEMEAVRSVDTSRVLEEIDAAIRTGHQARAAALVHRAGEAGIAPRKVFDTLLRYAVSEDGALHAEKYYRTVSEEFAATRPAFRWRHLVALARVTASEHGRPAPGMEEARRLLGV